MKPFLALKEQTASEAQINTGDLTNMTKISNALNRAYDMFWKRYLWTPSITIDREHTLQAGKSSLVIDADIKSILSVTEQSLQRVLYQRFVHVWSTDHILDKASQSGPYSYTKGGNTGIKVAPESDTAIFLQSSSSDDTFTCRVRGTDANGNFLTAEVQLAGTSSISSIDEFSHRHPIYVSKSQLSSGTITVKDSSGNVLDRIPPRKYANMYDIINFTAPADKDYTVYIAGKLDFFPMEYDEDMPLIDIGEALVLYAVSFIFADRGKIETSSFKRSESERLVEALVKQRMIQDSQAEDTNPIFKPNEMDLPLHGYN